MAGTIFWDVDTQVDFMVPDGKLYVPGAAAITENLERLTRHAREAGIPRVASVDDHTLADPEISDAPDYRETFPPHCLRGTEGQKKIPATAMRSPVVVPNRPEDAARAAPAPGAATAGDPDREEPLRRVHEPEHADASSRRWRPDTVVVYGVAQDVCDAHAIRGFLRARPCARGLRGGRRPGPSTPPAGRELLEEWKAAGRPGRPHERRARRPDLRIAFPVP